MAWIALGILSLVVLALIWRFFPPHASPAGDATAVAGEPFRWDAQAIRLVICYGVFGFGYIIPATFLPVMAKTALHGSPLFAWSWPVFGMAAALSTLCVAALVRRISNCRLWMVCHFIMAVGIVLPALWANLLSILLAALCVGGTFMVITLAAMQEAKRVAARNATGLIAAMTSAFAAGQILGPLTVTGGDFSIALLIAAAMLVASALLLISSDAKRTS
jgi:predicted MFS family arabinose efflux permease